ncbi:MAG: HmuY family protein [Bacteroidales bacterium]|nr:HmuY family protein [Bacteroidales bacterium]
MFKHAITFVVLLLVLTSCFKEDVPIPPHEKGDLKEEVIPLTQYYVNQVYFNLPTGEQVSMNQKNDFDLSFACADTAFIIRLNSATFMAAALTEYSELEEVTDTTGLVWKFDKSDGNPDSTALKEWITIEGADTNYLNKVWVINRGINELGFTLGLKKAVFTKLAGGKYYFTYSNMDNSDRKEMVVEKNSGYNYIQFSFEDGGVIGQIEPETENWDLLFSQYTTLLFTDVGDAYPYLVTGTLINPAGTMVAFDSTMNFADIVIDDVLFLDYSSAADAIGYEWKLLVGDINGGDFYYKTLTHYNYIIKSRNGIFYKLHFTGFYEKDTGEKGYPSFEYQRL